MRLDQVVECIRARLADPARTRLDHAPRVHLVFMREPYMQLVLDGKKTIESRFSINKVLPWQQVGHGDALIFKRSGGPVCAVAFANSVGFYRNEREAWDSDLVTKFSAAICVEDTFWQSMNERRYCTLIALAGVTLVEPFEVTKIAGDRRGWILLRHPQIAMPWLPTTLPGASRRKK